MRAMICRTNRFFQSKVLTSVGVTDKKLCPYYPNAPRNRPPETVRHLLGRKRDADAGARCVSSGSFHFCKKATVKHTVSLSEGMDDSILSQLTNVPGKRFGLHVTRDSKESYRGSSKVRKSPNESLLLLTVCMSHVEPRLGLRGNLAASICQTELPA